MRRRSEFVLFSKMLWKFGNLQTQGEKKGASYVEGYGYMKVINRSFGTRTVDPCSAVCGTSERRDPSMMVRVIAARGQ